jgi:glucose/arabinose dehydrogenase
MLGLALSPDYAKTRHVYIYYTYSDTKGVWNRVSRYIEDPEGLVSEEIILDGIPGSRVHNGGRIKFGPDRKLYVTTGEIWLKELAQNLGSLGGKILRMNLDGSVPEDNPFPSSVIYSYGNRNSQGLDWHPETGVLYASEHGPSGENGWYAHDEINIIEPGGNYGWPFVIGYSKKPDFIDPLYHTGDVTWAPSGIAFCTSELYPDWNGDLFIANLRGEHLRVIRLKPPDYLRIDSNSSLYPGEMGRLRDIIQSPEGYLYVCTSNGDGRGRPVPGDDIIVRMVDPPNS